MNALMAAAFVTVIGVTGCAAPTRDDGGGTHPADADGAWCGDNPASGPVYIEIRYDDQGYGRANPERCAVVSGTEVTWRGPEGEPVAFEIRFKAAVPMAANARERALPLLSQAGYRAKVKRTISGPRGSYDYGIRANGKDSDPAIIIK